MLYVLQVCWLLHGYIIINQILRTCAYIKIILESYPKLVSYFYSNFFLSHFAHSNRQLLWLREVWAVYVRALGLTPGAILGF